MHIIVTVTKQKKLRQQAREGAGTDRRGDGDGDGSIHPPQSITMASSSSAGKWWKVEETLVHLPGLLGEHPASGHTYLTPVDLHPLPRNAVIGWALLYDEPVDEENFKEALSHTIADFPVVAGRFAGPAVINHNNAGVPLVICKDTRRSSEVSNGGSFILQVDAPSSFSLKKDSGFPSLLNPMRLRQVYRGREAAVSFRLTHLACGGTVLGVTATHALVDGSSLCRLLMSLSLAYRGLDRPAPYLDRRCLTCQPIASLLTDGERGAMAEEKMATAAAVAASLSGRVQPLGSEAEAPCRPLVQDSLSVWQSLKFLGRVAWGALRGARGVGEVVARISPREIEACKRAAGGASRISKNDVAAAFAWTLLRKMQGSMGLLRGTDREQRARMLLAADLRRGGRCEGLPSEYFGNAALAVEVEVETGAAEDAAGAMMTLPLAAAAIRSTVSALKPEMTKR